MTLSLACLTSSGIVLSADSRQTYRNNANMTRIGTDSAFKLFQLSSKVGIVIAGRAFFPDGKGVLKNTGWYIEEFKRSSLPANGSVKEIASALNDYLVSAFLDPEVVRLHEGLTSNILAAGGKDVVFKAREKLSVPYSYTDKDGKAIENQWSIDTISFIVAGYDSDGIGRAYLTIVPEGPAIERTTESGAPLWIGQTDIVARILKGYGWEINALEFVKDARSQGKKVDDELNKMEYLFNWGTMTLQDAVDFCVLMTRMTEGIQRFSDGTVMNPGGIPGVGGHVNVATITSDEGFQWINKRNLVIGASEQNA